MDESLGSTLRRKLSRISASPRGKYRDLRFRSNVQHLFGPADAQPAANEAVLLTVMRDAKSYLDEFLDHYFSLGVSHAVLMDNGSVDGTLGIASSHKRVTVLRMDLTFGKHSVRARQYLLSRFARSGWGLIVDSDEFFHFPGSDRLGLRDLLDYLDRHDYTAVNANMLDMFPSGPLLEQGDSRDWRRSHDWFDLSGVDSLDYDLPDVEVDHRDIRVFRGGILGHAFGADVGRPPLLKHPLLRPEKGVRLIGSHRVSGARLADLSGALLHYKWAPGFPTSFGRRVAENSHRRHTRFYRRYLETLAADPSFSLKTGSAERLKDPQDLLDRGFMMASDRFKQWVAGATT